MRARTVSGMPADTRVRSGPARRSKQSRRRPRWYAARRLTSSGPNIEVYPSLRNGFEAVGSRSGARLKGRPDIITRNQDGEVTVYDVRDREPTAEDILRVKLTMYLLPRSNHGRWRRSAPSGRVLRPDGTEHRIDAGEIDGEFIERVAAVMRQLVSPEPAVRVPGASECGRCVLTSSECAETD